MHQLQKAIDPRGVALLAIAIALDQVAKWLVFVLLPSDRLVIVPRVFSLVRYLNHGTVGSLPVPNLAIIVISLALLTAVLHLLARRTASNAGLMLILAGGISNLADRIRFGGVRDILEIGPGMVVNLADATIILGIIIILKNSNRAPGGSAAKPYG